MKKVFLAFFLSLVSPLSVSSATISDCVVRIQNGRFAGGSGTVVDYQKGIALIVTCDHLFWDGQGAVSARWPDGIERPARLLKRHPRGGRLCPIEYDVALITVKLVKCPICANLAKQMPRPNATIWKAGYPVVGYAQRLDTQQGRLLSDAGELHSSILVRSGDSGGGYFDAHGLFIGVVSSSFQNPFTRQQLYSAGADLESVRKLMQTCWPNCPTCPRPPPRPRQPLQPPPAVIGEPVEPTEPSPLPGRPPDADKIAQEIANLREQIKNIKGIQGPQGPAGKDGRDGKDGKDGKDGQDADVKSLETEIALLRKEVDTLKETLGKLNGSIRIKIDPNGGK